MIASLRVGRAMIPSLFALALLLLLTASAQAQSPSPDPQPSDPPAVQEERAPIEGAANPLDAPLLTGGTADDTILQSEVLWYAVDADPGQQVTVAVEVVGRPDGATGEGTAIAATLTDPQRQPLVEAAEPFDGTADARLQLPATEIPLIDADRPLLSVSLRAPSGTADRSGTGYRLRLSVEVSGEAAALPTADPAGGVASPAPDQPDVVVTAAPVPEPAAPDVVGDVLPFALVALAVGGVAGFELSRRGL